MFRKCQETVNECQEIVRNGPKLSGNSEWSEMDGTRWSGNSQDVV